MATGHISGLRDSVSRTYWDSDKQQYHGTLAHDPSVICSGKWYLAGVSLTEDSIESAQTKLVLRGEMGDGDDLKIEIPDAICPQMGSLNTFALESGLAHICSGIPRLQRSKVQTVILGMPFHIYGRHVTPN